MFMGEGQESQMNQTPSLIKNRKMGNTTEESPSRVYQPFSCAKLGEKGNANTNVDDELSWGGWRTRKRSLNHHHRQGGAKEKGNAKRSNSDQRDWEEPCWEGEFVFSGNCSSQVREKKRTVKKNVGEKKGERPKVKTRRGRCQIGGASTSPCLENQLENVGAELSFRRPVKGRAEEGKSHRKGSHHRGKRKSGGRGVLQ